MYLVKHQHAIAAGVDVEVQCVDRQRRHDVFLAAIKHLDALHREVVSVVVPGVTNKRDVRIVEVRSGRLLHQLRSIGVF
jgi:hypothetical protein